MSNTIDGLPQIIFVIIILKNVLLHKIYSILETNNIHVHAYKKHSKIKKPYNNDLL